MTRYACPNCGATTTTKPPSATCPHCDAPLVTEPDAHEAEPQGEQTGQPWPTRRL